MRVTTPLVLAALLADVRALLVYGNGERTTLTTMTIGGLEYRL